MDGEGRHERGTGERDEELAGPWREQAARREEQRRRHGFEGRNEALEHAILTDADDPLAAASGTMRDPGDAPAVVRAFEQDASLGNLRIPGAAGGFEERPMERRLVVRHDDDGQIAFVAAAGSTEADVLVGEGETLRDELVPAGAPPAWVVSSRTPFNEHNDPWSGDPGDEQPHHVETVRVVVIRDAEGGLIRHHDPGEPGILNLADGEHATVEEWASAAVPVRDEDLRPTVYAPYGTLTDDALERLEELGLQVEEIGPDDDPFGKGSDLHTDQEWDELAVADTAADGTVRELRLLEGGAVDLTPRRKVQVWIDLRFQYVSDHPYGAPDTLEEERLRTIGAFVEQFGNMTVGNNFEAIEGMAIQSVVGHILDKPGDPFPAAG